MGLRLLALSLLLCGPVAAAEERVRVRAEVVAVSSDGDHVEPPQLAAMRTEFQRHGRKPALTSFRRLSEKRLELVRGVPQVLPLPGNGQVTVALEQLRDDQALVSVEVPKLVKTVLQLGRRGTLYQQLSHNEREQLVFLVLHPD
ncbi:MAG: hypothetical protein RL653_3809 [Pseudomonadota bacterium]|jgi:hypothetical protein